MSLVVIQTHPIQYRYTVKKVAERIARPLSAVVGVGRPVVNCA
jgi:hypothetical protein